MEIEYCRINDGRCFFVRGHVPIADFMAAVEKEVDSDDLILTEEPVHLWMRACRDFDRELTVYTEAEPASRGAFKCTLVQDY